MTRYWTLKPGQGPASLTLKEAAFTELHPGQVRISIKANSINARDLMVAMGHAPMPVGEEIVPVSDGAGVITEIGADVTGFSPGDRVVIAFNPAHQSGPFTPDMAAHALGEMRDGVLASEVVIEESALVRLPDNVSFDQAACLPCVGVTAWNALFEVGRLLPGQTVLSTGTGMVSLTALKLAKAAGVRFGITSSDDKKIEMARQLGADFGINYRTQPDWPEAVRQHTNGRGADVVLETVGPPSIAQSVKAAAHNGRVMQIGFKGPEGPSIEVLDMLVGGVSVIPVMVGSKAMLQNLVTAVSVNQISMPVHQRFHFDEAPQAFSAFMQGEGFGKTILLSE